MLDQIQINRNQEYSYSEYDESESFISSANANQIKSAERPSWFVNRVIPGSANHTILLQNALVLIENDEMQLAQSLLGNILAENSKVPQAIYWMGYSFLQKSDFKNSYKCFSELVKIKKDGESLFLQADMLYKMGADDEALYCYLEAFDFDLSDEQLFDGYKSVGNIYIRQQNISKAEEYYCNALDINSKSDVLAVNLGTLYIQKSEIENALIQFRKAISLNKKNDNAWVGLALIHRNLGDFDLAWANLVRALDFNFENKTALELFVEWGVTDYRLIECEEYLINFMEKNSEDVEVSLLLAKVFYCQGKKKKFNAEFIRTKALDGLNEKVLNFLNVLKSQSVSETC